MGRGGWQALDPKEMGDPILGLDAWHKVDPWDPSKGTRLIPQFRFPPAGDARREDVATLASRVDPALWPDLHLIAPPQ